jgi:hypothetical protein
MTDETSLGHTRKYLSPRTQKPERFVIHERTIYSELARSRPAALMKTINTRKTDSRGIKRGWQQHEAGLRCIAAICTSYARQLILKTSAANWKLDCERAVRATFLEELVANDVGLDCKTQHFEKHEVVCLHARARNLPKRIVHALARIRNILVVRWSLLDNE